MEESSTAATAKIVWRISVRKYSRDAFSGSGSSRYGARWSPPGQAVVYTSQSLSLASVEFFVHLNEADMAAPLVAIAAEIPAGLQSERLEIADLPGNWRRSPAPKALRELGAAWLATAKSAILAVPSVIINRECNYLLNPAHPDFARIKIRRPEPFGFDSRMWKRKRR